MSEKIYDVFADEYIDAEDKDPIAPPERYREITPEMLVQNAARWLCDALKEEQT